jgi:hypothetical protein
MKRDGKWLGKRVCGSVIAASCVVLLQCSGGTSRTSESALDGPSTPVPAPVADVAASSLRAAYVGAVQRDASESYWVLPGALPAAENEAQGFRTVFERDNVTIHSTHDARWHLEMRLVGIGHGTHLQPADRATGVQSTKNRVEYQRGSVTEWYLNGPLGLEQGFTLAEKPGSDDPRAEDLQLELAIGGDLKPVATHPGVIDLQDARGLAPIRVRDLYVHDAKGTQLMAQMAVEGGYIRLRVDDRNAVYPLVVDPTFSQQAEFTASDAAANNFFGIAVAIDQDTALIGADDNVQGGQTCGAAYVFLRSGTLWSQQQKITPPTCATGDLFGASVALSGNTALIGARGRANGQGVAYIYTRSGSTWTLAATLAAPDGAASDHFGGITSLSGTTAVVTAFNHTAAGNANAGAVYVFTGPSWTLQQELQGTTVNQFFGTSAAVDSSTSTLVIGAIGENSFTGNAYVYTSSGTWNLQATLPATGLTTGAFYGYSVGISGNTAVVSAPHQSSNLGAAWVWNRSGTTWTQGTKLSATDGAAGDFFGWSVSLNVDTIAVGAPYKTVSGNSQAGEAYQYFRSDGVNWVQQALFVPSDPAASDHFGQSVSVSGGTALVGASGKNSGAGAAYAFTVAQTTITATCGGSCTTSDTVTVSATNMPGYPTDWIAIAVPNSLPTQFVAHKYTGGIINPTVTFTGLGIGTYVARAFQNNSYTMLAESSPPFTVSPSTGPTTVSQTCSTTPCTTSSTITVTYSGMPGYTNDYIALAQQGSAPTSYYKYVYTKGQTSGTVTFTSLPPGVSVVARAFQNNTTTQLGSDSNAIAIQAAGATTIDVPCAATSCISTWGPSPTNIVVTFTNMPGNQLDWIAVIENGRADSSYQTYKYTGGQVNGSVSLGTLPPGTYNAKAFQNNTYTQVGNTFAFTVTPATLPTPTLTGTSPSNNTGVVTFSNMAGYRLDYITLALPGSAATSYVQYKYTFGTINGSVTFSNVASGNYVARAFFDNSNTQAGVDSAQFHVLP